jgi:hypothetical protein
MANPFYVSPLGGLDVGQSVTNMANQWDKNEMMDMQRTQFEQQQKDREAQAAQQAKNKDLAARMVAGDLLAGQELIVANPEYAAKIDSALGIQNDQQKAQVSGWLEKYLSTPAADRDAFLQSTASATPFTVDDDLLAMDPAQRDQYANMIAGRYLNKEQLGMLQGAGDLTAKEQADIDIKKEANELRRLEVEQRNLDRQISRETNELKRQELEAKLEANKAKQEQGKRDAVAKQESTIARFDNALSTINKIESSPGFGAAVGARMPFVDQLPGSEAQETIGLIDTLKSQSFLNEISQMKGMGALSNAEGAKLESAISSLNRDMKEDAFKRSLQSIRDYFTVAKERARKQMGAEPEPEQAQTKTVNWADL